MKKICFLTDSVFNIGGVQRCVTVVANELIALGYDVSIICLDRYPIDYKLYNLSKNVNIKFIYNEENDKIKFFWAKVFRKLNRTKGFFSKYEKLLERIYYTYCKNRNFELVKYIEKNNFDVVIGAGGDLSVLLAILKNQITAKTYGWQHSSCDSYFVRNDGKFHYQVSLFKKYIPKLDKYIVLTKYDSNWIKEQFGYSANCIYNPKSFYTNKISDLKEKNFIAVGRYDKVKGFDRLITAFSKFVKKDSSWKLYIIGEGKMYKKLKEQIRSLSLENNVFLISKTNNIIHYYLKSSIYLLSSYYEGLPMVLIEACECGLPIISYDLPCCKEQFNNCSLLISNGNIDAFADAMYKLTHDAHLLHKLGKEAKINSNKYDISKIMKEWMKIL